MLYKLVQALDSITCYIRLYLVGMIVSNKSRIKTENYSFYYA